MKNESGRSMVEMLGVLAIIGVLSIGGIAGYTLAMRRYKANNIVSVMSLASVYAMSAKGGEGINTTSDDYVAIDCANDLSTTTPSGLDSISANRQGNVYVAIGDNELCEIVADILGKKTKKNGTGSAKKLCTKGSAATGITGEMGSDPTAGNFIWAEFQ